jgi:hypothetical protein
MDILDRTVTEKTASSPSAMHQSVYVVVSDMGVSWKGLRLRTLRKGNWWLTQPHPFQSCDACFPTPLPHFKVRPCPSNDGGNGDAPVFGLEINMNRYCKSGPEAMENRMKVRGYHYNQCLLKSVIFVGCVFFFSGRQCPQPRFCGLEMRSLWIYQTLPTWLPLNVPGFHLKMPRSGTHQDLIKMASSPSGLQVASACAHSHVRCPPPPAPPST